MPDDDIELLQQSIMHGGEQAFEVVPLALRKIINEKQWQARVDKDGKPFVSFEAFAKHRLWQGLETTIDDLRVHCRKHPDVERLILSELEPGATLADEPRDEKGKYRRSNTTTGRGVAYTVKRLKRDRPDLAAKVIGGKLSANAAAIKAGFRKQPTALERVLKLWPLLTKAERAQVCACEDVNHDRQAAPRRRRRAA